MTPTPTPIPAIPAIVAVAPVVVPATQWLSLMISGCTALAALMTVVLGVVNLLRLTTIHISFNSLMHELMDSRESSAKLQGAHDERVRADAKADVKAMAKAEVKAEEHGK